MKAWTRTKLGDQVSTQKGFAFKSKWYQVTGKPIVRVSDFTDDAVNSSKLVCIPETVASDYLKYELVAGDVVVQTVGSWPSNPASVVGKCVKIPSSIAGALLNQNAVKLSRTKDLNRQFLFYLLRSDDFKTYIIGTAQGAASQAAITLESIYGYEFNLPPPAVQQSTVSILSAYDNLIEINTRRIAILEEMARRLFEEWFMKFRFPGHGAVKVNKTEIGFAPEGWRIRPISEAFEVLGGGTPSKAILEYWIDGEINWYTPTDLTGARTSFIEASAKKITARGLAESSARLFPAYSVMMTSRATLGVIAINTTGAATNQGFITCIPNEHMPLFFLYHFLRANEDEFERHASGATFKEITKGTFKKLPILLPSKDLTLRFEAMVSPMMHSSRMLQAANTNLRAARDLLLPKLISGEIDLTGMGRHIDLAADRVAAE